MGERGWGEVCGGGIVGGRSIDRFFWVIGSKVECVGVVLGRCVDCDLSKCFF